MSKKNKASNLRQKSGISIQFEVGQRDYQGRSDDNAIDDSDLFSGEVSRHVSSYHQEERVSGRLKIFAN